MSVEETLTKQKRLGRRDRSAVDPFVGSAVLVVDPERELWKFG
jgi:hypothetical protein